MIKTIQARLWLLVSLFIVMLTVLSGINIWGNKALNDLIAEMSELTQARNITADMAGIIRDNRIQFLLALQHNPTAPRIVKLHDHPAEFHLNNIAKGREKVESMWENYLNISIVKRNLQAENNTITLARANYKNDFVVPTLGLLKEESFFDANVLILNKGNPLATALLGAIGKANEKISQSVEENQQKAKALSSMIDKIQVISTLIAIFAGLFLAWLIIRSVKGAINQISDSISTIATTQSFNSQLSERKDEFGVLVTDFNRLLSELQSSIYQANNTVAAIAQGDFKQRMSGNYTGDLEKLQQGVNASAEQVDFMMSQLAYIMHSLKEGNLDARMDERVAPSFRQLVDGTMINLATVIHNINHVMSAMQQGKFDGRVTSDAAGDWLEMKERINGSMQDLNDAISSISNSSQALANGNLTQLTSGHFRGDLASLTDSINRATNSLRGSFCQVQAQSNEVAQSASQVAEGNKTLSNAIQAQASSLEETAAAMEEINSQVKQAAEQANKSSELAIHARDGVRSGSDSMKQAVIAMQDIHAVSSQITGIVSIIDGLAFQTNLLALNAAVEAARAGEHGRGFAVVASEVRALAGKSADAAKDIKGLIEQTASKIAVGIETIARTEKTLLGITDQVEEMAILVENIANNAKEQSIGMSQMNEAVTSIEQTVQQSAALVEESASLAEYLGDVAQQLDDLVGKFQLGDCGSATAYDDSEQTLGNILVVDDNVPNQKVASALLRKLGYHIDTAENGKEALKKLSTGNYLVVLMDIGMPIMDGCTATGHIRRGDQGINKHIPIIALTGHTKAHKQKALDAGMNDFMTKPINPTEIAQKVSQLTGKQSTYSAPAKTKPAMAITQQKGEWSDF